MVETARAHHAATGGPNPQWADWYAEHMVHELNETLNIDWSTGQLSVWLTQSDIRYRGEEPDVSWPHAYADWIVETVEY